MRHVNPKPLVSGSIKLEGPATAILESDASQEHGFQSNNQPIARYSGPPYAEAMEPEDRFFEASRLRLHYVVWGDESKPALVLVHGSRDHARSWDFVAERMLDRYCIYALDLRGHGDSEHAVGGSYPLTAYVGDVEKFLEVLGREQVYIL